MQANSTLPSLPELPGASSEPVFNEPWEASAFAIAVCLNQAGLFSWAEWVEVRNVPVAVEIGEQASIASGR